MAIVSQNELQKFSVELEKIRINYIIYINTEKNKVTNFVTF